MISCKLCGRLMKGLTLHLIKLHKTTPKLYLQQFPGADLFSPDVLAGSNFGGRSMKGKQKDKPMSEETRKKISEFRSSFVGWEHSASTIAKMKETSQKPTVKTAKRDSLLKYYETHPEAKTLLKEKAKARIALTGLHLKRGTTTKLEQLIINMLVEHNIAFKREHRSKNMIMNAYRFFDFYLPELKIIIEADGEFWHRQELRFKIDMLKNKDAISQDCTFLRLSDVYDKQLFENPSDMLVLILDKKKHEAHTSKNIAKRIAYFAENGFTPSKEESIPMPPEERSKVLSEKGKKAWEHRKQQGFTVSLETREKISKSRVGKIMGPREKPYVLVKPRPPFSEETKAKMRASALARREREKLAKESEPSPPQL